ncbi:MAG: DUF58 domain-containing protein [Chloroflexi bacterium]|nr:DUF58 domain-containing protein [Chloroflexota bacterium]
MKRIYLILFLLALTLFSALSTGFYLLYRLVYALALILVSSYIWTWISSWGIEARVERRTSRAAKGENIEARITVRNTSFIPKSWLEVQEMTDMPGHLEGMAIGLPSRGFRSWKVSTPCKRRGIYTLGPLRVTSGDLFGLFRRERYFGDVHTLIVYPQIINLHHFSIPAADLPGEGSAVHRSFSITPSASTVKDYTYGESLRRIHWPSTARMGKLMIKEFDQGPSSDIWLFLDLHWDVQAEQEEESTDDYGATIAASIARKYLDAELSVGFVAHGDDRYVLPPETGPAQMARIMEVLAKGKAQGKVPLEEALAQEEALYSRNSSVVIITPSYREEWIFVLKELMRRRIKVLVILVEPSSFGGRDSNLHLSGNLARNGIPSYVVSRGDDLSAVLSHMYRGPQMAEVFPGHPGRLL